MADFFISYTAADTSWAEWIGYVLEEQGVTIILQGWDFPVGSNFVAEMQKAASTASRTIMVLSPDYLKSQFATSEWAAAFADDPEGVKRKLVPVVVRACDVGGLLKAIVHINLVNLEQEQARSRLLSGINPGRAIPARRPIFPGAGSPPPFPGEIFDQIPVKIFISYTRKDEVYRRKLNTHLDLLKERGLVEVWHDRMIEAGQEFDPLIIKKIDAADIILLLVSPEFMESPYCKGVEVIRAMQRHEAGTVRVIPIILRYCYWQDGPFGKLNALPTDGRPVRTWGDRDKAFLDVITRLQSVIESVRRTQVRLPWSQAQPLSASRSFVNTDAEFSHPAHQIRYGNTWFQEVALLIDPIRGPWNANEISWKEFPRPFVPSSFWDEVDTKDPLAPLCASDTEPRKHLRLVAASQRRDIGDDQVRLDCIWQPVSWHNSSRTNGRLDRKKTFHGAPLWAWFAANDLLLPPVEGSEHRDSPLANRFAVNLAVILAPKQGEHSALFQIRMPELAAHPRGIECGVSESVHGDQGWLPEEQDVRGGRPDVYRTAERCLWQELGIARHGSLEGKDAGAFDLKIQFTAMVVNKQEMSPRLLGYIEIDGTLENVEIASRQSRNISHKEFGRRPDKDAIPWERVLNIPVTREAFASVFHRPHLFGPECRARLYYYLKTRFPTNWHTEPLEEDAPDWMRDPPTGR